MASSKEIKRRIKSITSTKKITKAMEMVAASKMRKAVGSAQSTRSYSTMAWQLVLSLAGKTESEFHTLLVKRPVKKVGLVLISSNRGLCGGFNSGIAMKAVKEVERLEKDGAEVEIITMGRRGRDILRRFKPNIAADFTKEDLTTNTGEISGLSHLILEDFIAGKLDKVVIAYTDFVSSIIQKPRLLQLLPLEMAADEELGKVSKEKEKLAAVEQGFEYLFEPNPDEVLKNLLPRLIEMQIYQAVLESDASEHSTRMMAMRNATDAARDMIDDLSLAYNQARQAGITREIAEIAGGKAALE
jgi:F-type H+-transporting ATPase subunit gamma